MRAPSHVGNHETDAARAQHCVVERREAPTGTSKVSQFLVKTVLGGNEDFEVDLVNGMNTTLARIKSAAEGK